MARRSRNDLHLPPGWPDVEDPPPAWFEHYVGVRLRIRAVDPEHAGPPPPEPVAREIAEDAVRAMWAGYSPARRARARELDAHLAKRNTPTPKETT